MVRITMQYARVAQFWYLFSVFLWNLIQKSWHKHHNILYICNVSLVVRTGAAAFIMLWFQEWTLISCETCFSKCNRINVIITKYTMHMFRPYMLTLNLKWRCIIASACHPPVRYVDQPLAARWLERMTFPYHCNGEPRTLSPGPCRRSHRELKAW